MYFISKNLYISDNSKLTPKRGNTLGVVGESGCGKSTLGRVILNILPATEGEVLFKEKNIVGLKGQAQKNLRRNMQIIFQDPYSSIDPRLTVSEIIAEPFRRFDNDKGKVWINKQVEELMNTVGLAQRLKYSYPHELDGGRRQRIGVARALALNPDFIVCDEPVSALDVSIQAQILNLLQDLQEEKGLTYLFITHDLSVVKHISNEIMVMYLGQVVEKALSEELFSIQMHPYTQALLSAIPIAKTGKRHKRILLNGEITSPINPKPGCRFAARCPYAKDICNSETPLLRELSPQHFAACHFAEEYTTRRNSK